MFTSISVLVPTRGRVNRLTRLLDSFYATSTGRAELYFRVDEDDEETRRFLTDPLDRVVVGPRLAGYGSLPTFFNELAAVAPGDLLMCGNDDMVFVTPEWDRLILDEA